MQVHTQMTCFDSCDAITGKKTLWAEKKQKDKEEGIDIWNKHEHEAVFLWITYHLAAPREKLIKCYQS